MAQRTVEPNECVSIGYDEVPPFLHNSTLYLQLDEGDERGGQIDFQRTCFKADDTVNGVDDLRQLLQVMIFWGLDVIPDSILDFCHNNDLNEWQAATVDLPDHGNLHKILTECCGGTESVLPAANSGHPEVVQHWMRMHPPENLTEPTEPCSEVASIGNLQLLIELRIYDYPWNAETCEAAAGSGSLDCLKYLHQQACPWDESLCTAAAAKGHLDCLQYLHESGCPWYEDDICPDAAEAGHLSCLKFAHEHGGTLNDYVTATVHLDCLRYALEHDCPIHEDVCSGVNLMDLPIEHVWLLQEHGVAWAENICVVSLQCPLEHTEYLIQRGCTYGADIAHEAVWTGAPEHLAYLIEETLLEMNAEMFSIAVMTGSLECVEVLADLGCPCNFVWHMELEGYRLYDERIQPCIQYVAERGWVCSDELVSFVFGNNLPLCWEYMRNEGIVDSTKLSPYDSNYVHKGEDMDTRLSNFLLDSESDDSTES